jgi:hypothetical protein
MKRMVGKMKTGLEQGLKVYKKRPAQKLEKIRWYANWAWGFVGACFGDGRFNFFQYNSRW